MKLICHICKHEIAEIRDPGFPLSGAMFVSKDPFHGVPAPWSPVVDWESMYCPMCHFRAFPVPVDGLFELTTDEGTLAVSEVGVVLLAPEALVEVAPVEVPTQPPAVDGGQAEAIAEPVADAVEPDAVEPDAVEPDPVEPVQSVEVPVKGSSVAAKVKPSKKA